MAEEISQPSLEKALKIAEKVEDWEALDYVQGGECNSGSFKGIYVIVQREFKPEEQYRLYIKAASIYMN